MAENKARTYSTLTIKKLYALSGNKCAFPDCSVVFLRPEEDLNYSNICHIEDANPGCRYNPNMTDKERAHYDNLVLFCPNHHIETNNETLYPKETLLKIKNEHESKILQILSGTGSLSKNPSALNEVINKIGVSFYIAEDLGDPNNAPDPESKISYNNIKRYKPIIEEYKVYQGKLNKIYEEIEKDGSSKKSFVLNKIRSLYLIEKGKYSDIKQIRLNADDIISNVEKELWKLIESTTNLNSSIPIEAIQISLLIILVDAFMRCKILEEPKNDN